MTPMCLTAVTWSLEVERHQLGATDPHGQRVIVGRVQPLSSRVNPGQLPPVVLQEALPSAAGSKLFRLGLREGGHVAVASSLRPDLWRSSRRVTSVTRQELKVLLSRATHCPRQKGRVCSRPPGPTAPPRSSSFAPFASPPASADIEETERQSLPSDQPSKVLQLSPTVQTRACQVSELGV